jgi:hypothetical protein
MASLCLLFCLTTAIAADATCDVSPPNSPPDLPCGRPDLVQTFRKSCPMGSGMQSCPPESAMPPAEIQCVAWAESAFCEAWPQSAVRVYRYEWTVLQGLEDYFADGTSRTLVGNCRAGRPVRVRVTVTAPNGASSSAEGAAMCWTNQ